MTGHRLIGQIALRDALADGTVVVLDDVMQAPMIALDPRVRLAPAGRATGIVPVAGGAIVRGPEAVPPVPPTRRLAIGSTPATATRLGREVWGRSGFLVSDLRRIEGAGIAVPGDMRAGFRARLDEYSGAEPLALLREQGEIGEHGVLETGEAVFWLDALHCLRGLEPDLARRVAWRGCADGADMALMQLTVPDGRIRLVFDRIRAAPKVDVAGAARLRRIDAATLEIDTGERADAVARITVRPARARLLRVGLVIAADRPAAAVAGTDPLEVYADPIARDFLS